MLESIKRIDSAEVNGKRVLVRADLNVPTADGKVTDATRIEQVLPLIRDLSQRGAKVVVMSHFGRPKGKRVEEMSLKPVADKIAEMLAPISVHFAPDCIGEEAKAAVNALEPGGVCVLENLRFHAGEEANDAAFAAALAELGDIYVNDAFSAAHRAHASTEGIAHLLPAYAGPAMMSEIEALTIALEKPHRPVAALIGGAKVSTKIDVLSNLVEKVNLLVIGGAMANTFLHVEGRGIGNSLFEPGEANTVEQIITNATESGCQILLPKDAVVAPELRKGAATEVRSVTDIPDDAMILDIGPDTVAEISARLADCHTALWNGPLGAFEVAPFGEGTFAVAREVARLTEEGGVTSIAGGGDTVAALNAAGVTDAFSYVSTAGGAFLEWLEGRELPGVAALKSA
ncbi:phosphoglycerate kinase [Dichotomicrobium thermohalophilum]|uniref:Phosphoglycerate kinase n=1 Tax=Dichotomicrobium thermohalophilum TaxID=933063 RepID=A0A397Q316_9HYPH|nr:phosphoglycerate kinase [Dichotomicrobium thermohalophilum]RIA55522.1 phosphoglycerate kinase [Dichotomicrobium thermohalophilum]